MTGPAAPATPPQMAANLIAATEAAGAEDRARSDVAEAALAELLGRVRGAVERVDPADADGAGIEIIAAWYDALLALRRDLDEWSARTGRTTRPVTSWREDIRAQFSRGGLRAVLRDGTHLLEALDDTVAALTDREAREVLEAHRGVLAGLLNTAQDRLDA